MNKLFKESAEEQLDAEKTKVSAKLNFICLLH